MEEISENNGINNVVSYNFSNSNTSIDKLPNNLEDINSDILTYSEDNQNNMNDNTQKTKNLNKEDLVIKSTNSEVKFFDFINQDKKEKTESQESIPKSDSKNSSKLKMEYFDIGTKTNKSFEYSINTNNNNKHNENKESSGLQGSLSQMLSEFDIKDVSLSQSQVNNNNEKNQNISNTIKESLITNNNITKSNKDVNEDKDQSTSVCNYNNQSNSVIFEQNNKYISPKKNVNNILNINEIEKYDSNKEIIIKPIDLQNNINNIDININNINLNKNSYINSSNTNENRYKQIHKKYLEEMKSIKKNLNLTASSEKSSGQKQNLNINKSNKFQLKYTKAQCYLNDKNELNNNKNENTEKRYISSDIKDPNQKTINHKEKFQIDNNIYMDLISPKKDLNIQLKFEEENFEITNNANINTTNINLSINRPTNFSIDPENIINNANNIKNINNTANYSIVKENNSSLNVIKESAEDKNNILNKNKKTVPINNKNINIQKKDFNNFFYNPKYNEDNNKLRNNVIYEEINSNASNINKLMSTPDNGKIKKVPSTCIHKETNTNSNLNKKISKRKMNKSIGKEKSFNSGNKSLRQNTVSVFNELNPPFKFNNQNQSNILKERMSRKINKKIIYCPKEKEQVTINNTISKTQGNIIFNKKDNTTQRNSINNSNTENKNNIVKKSQNKFIKKPTVSYFTGNKDRNNCQIKYTITNNLTNKTKISLNNNTSNNNSSNNKINNSFGAHKKINTQFNIENLISKFNLLNRRERKNTKSLYNFGNIFFINQTNQIANSGKVELVNNIKENEKNTITSVKNINKKPINKIIHNKMNSVNYSLHKVNPKIISDFSKYKKKCEIDNKCSNFNENNNKDESINNKIENKKYIFRQKKLIKNNEDNRTDIID